MLAPFPETHKVQVPDSLARELLLAAERLPLYDNKEFYSVELQQFVHDSIREANTDAFDELVSLIKERLQQRPYCVLVSGLRFDEGNRLFVAINRAFGELVARPYEKPRAQLVHYIQPQTDIGSARGGRESERLHTDCADWETPVELISMVCVNADNAGGGRSRILDLDTIRTDVAEHLGPATLKLFENEPAPWQLAPYLGGGVAWRPVLTDKTVCWRRYTIDLALRSEGANLSEEMLRALDAFEEVVTNTTGTVDFMMREGELLFSDNTRTIHARTPLADPATSTRLMIRSWIRTS
ncbi:MAG TPA: TauD/TfdA family dioxygenase [Pyrinomonadaceae bacterium]|nr:TauD/TfdA family dioxygenase [Pyrinomonadaceae bacterium]